MKGEAVKAKGGWSLPHLSLPGRSVSHSEPQPKTSGLFIIRIATVRNRGHSRYGKGL